MSVRKIALGCIFGGAGILLVFVVLTIVLALLFPERANRSPAPVARPPSPTSPAVSNWTPRPTLRTWTPTPTTSQTPHTALTAAVNTANEYIVQQGGPRATYDDMLNACEVYQELGWDYLAWLEVVRAHIEQDDPPPQAFLRRQAFFEGLMMGMEHATGRAQEGCRLMNAP